MPSRPTARPSTATATAVLASALRRRIGPAAASTATPRASSMRALPRSTCRPPTCATIPWPATASNRSGSSAATPRSAAAATIACPNGCSEPRSAEAARRSTSSSVQPGSTVTMSVTTGSPRVIVPVLSSTTVVSAPARSSASPERNRIPSVAPLPVPTITAVGVARPIAHGQAITSTATMLISARVKAEVSPVGGGASSSQPAKVSSARPITAGTNTAETWSASRWMGALLPWASSTSRTICARAVSLPTRVASKRMAPILLSVAPITSSPGAFSTGSDSPVIIDSSTAVPPFDDHAVDRDLLARPDQDDIAPLHLIDRDVLLDALAHDARRLRLQAHQPPDGFAGAAVRSRLEELAQQDQGDDDRRRLEVEVAGDQPEEDGQGVDVGHRRAHGDQHVHVGRAVAQRLVGPDVVLAAHDELHRRRQREHHPVVPTRVRQVVRHQPQVAPHAHQEQRHGQAQADEQQPSLPFDLLLARLLLHIHQVAVRPPAARSPPRGPPPAARPG